MDEERANGCDSVRWRVTAAQYLSCLNLFLGKDLLSVTLEPAFHSQLRTFSPRLPGQHFPDPCLIKFYICGYVSTSSAQNKLTLWSHRNLIVSSEIIMCYFLDSATICVFGNMLKNRFGPLVWLFWPFLVANVGYDVFYVKYLKLCAFKTQAQCLSYFKTLFNGN